MSSDPPKRRGVVAVIVRDERLLVIRRSQMVVAPGAFCFPGGGIEADESEEQALVREIREELNVAIRPLRRIWQSETPWRVELAWWLAEFETTVEPVPAPAEVESIHWYTPAEMALLPELLESNRHFLEAIARGKIPIEF
jgi:8-oxo-dGTP diphosphatase